MINLFFFLKFKSQLRRTKPDIVRQIDESLSRAIADAGGKVTGDRFVISAVFNEDTIGFWLDMYILIENLKKNINSSREFFGFSLVICSKYPDSPDLLCRFLSGVSGVFVDDKAAKKLVPYASFDNPSVWLKAIKKRKYGCGSYYKISELKVFKPSSANDLYLKSDVTKAFMKEEGKNTLVTGPFYLQMRAGMYDFYYEINKNFPPLTICFETTGLGSIVDIWSLSIRSISSGQPVEDIDSLWTFLFRERIRDEVSEYSARCVKQFLLLVFDYYMNIAVKKRKTPILILENVHLAESNALKLLLDSLAEFNRQSDQELLILGTAEDSISSEKLDQLEDVFDKVKNIADLKINTIYYPRLSVDLWEIIYAISLLSRYFSPELFQRLFEEEEKNPIMINKAFSILHTMGIIDDLREPRLMSRHFEEHAIKVIDDKAQRVKALVRGRLLNWAERRNLNPCFRLLLTIFSLEGSKQIDDLLLLKSFSSDIVNKSITAIEMAMNNGQFEEMVTVKASAIRQIFKTSKVLNAGSEKDIETVFNESQLDNLNSVCDSFPVLKAQILVNHCSYYLGRHDEKEAAEKAKEAILVGQNKNSFCLPQAYRLFSLVCLSKQQVNETIEYLSFALSNAESNGNYHELAVSAYYMAAAKFLHGDVYNASHLARKSIKQALAAGRPDWADRSRFLEGRIEFDLGNYSKAHDIFEGLIKEPYGSMTCEKENLMAAWIYRSKIYFQDPNTPKPQPANNDADLFEIEAAYLAGDYKKAFELSGSHAAPFAEENFLYTEQADWRSGFAQCEHLYFSQGEIQSRMLSLFHSLALSRLSQEGNEEAIHDIQKILLDERLCEMDPLNAFYFYAKYLILEQSGASLVDMSTAVSIAFKRLQRRAGRIEDIETRRQYLNGSRWNHELSLAAKEFKLI
ncbi:MAG: hypothetical protein LBI28_11520 [Treponema sp.]|jgi:hypothetical protein|nr:hypothetical protein [Treponema sp.]